MWIMDRRPDDIREEISRLLAQQQAILDDPSIMELPAAELDAYTARNQRLRDLCRELITIS